MCTGATTTVSQIQRLSFKEIAVSRHEERAPQRAQRTHALCVLFL